MSRRLNVPYMLGLLLLVALSICSILIESVNAPFGARCFLTGNCAGAHYLYGSVLMHLLALGAF